MSDGELLQAFEQHQRVRGLARKTIDRRRYSLQKLAVCASPVRLLDVTAPLIEDWLSTYRRAETRHAYLADVRALFKWARKRGLVLLDPTEDMDTIKVPRRLPRPMEEEELALAIATARDPRLRLVILLGAFAGLRRFEIAQLRGEDCTRHWLVIRAGKGGRDGSVPMHPVLWSAIRAFGVETGWMFESPYGGHISQATIGTWIRTHFDQLGIVGGVHRTRHRFGTKVAEAAGGNMLVVKELMRHANLETSQAYVAFDSSRLQPYVDGLPAAGQ